MVEAFWSSVGGNLANRWVAASAPALVFWVGVALVWVVASGGPSRLAEPAAWLDGQPTAVQVIILVAGLLVVAASAVVVSRLTTPALRLLEGYWPSWWTDRRTSMIATVRAKAKADEQSWQELMARHRRTGHLSAQEHDSLAVLERRRRRLPSDPDRLMPTRTGNILRAAEARPQDKYGLDGVSVWPRLWLVMPDSTRQELATARGALDSAVAAAMWGALFAVLVPLAVLSIGLGGRWSAGPLLLACLLAISAGGCVVAATIRWWVPARAEVFGDLVESAYDLYRCALYEHVRWPMPKDPSEERRIGRELTEYLWRGSDTASPRFTAPS